MVTINKSDKMKLDRAIDTFNEIANTIASSILEQVLKENPSATKEEIKNTCASIMSTLLNEVDDFGSWDISWEVKE